jgi:hypothetical protein
MNALTLCEVSKDPKASPLERETALLTENAALRGRMARLCRAVSARMQADEPTPEERLELMKSYDSACALLANDQDQTRPAE